MMILMILGITLLGFALIILDIMVLPGGIVIAVGSGVIIYSIYLTFTEFGLLPAGIHTAAALAVVPVIVMWSLSRVALRNEMHVEDGFVGVEDQSHLIGLQGTAYSDLRPSGKVTLDVEGKKERLDCISEGGYIEKGERVRVTDSRGPSLVVVRVPVKASV